MSALLAYFNHNLYLCGVPVARTTWFISLGLSMLMAASSGAVYASFALERMRLRGDKGS